MAKARERYESTGVLAVPKNIDFAGQREASAGYTALSNKLDQMSTFFMGQAEGMAKIEGAEYGAANIPTQQQIDDAIKNDTLDELQFPGDNFSVFGRAAKNAGLTTLYDDLEFSAKKKILDHIIDYEKKELDPSGLTEHFDTIINGYASVFDEQSPALARKFRADVGLYGYTKMQGEMSEYLKVEKKKQKAAFQSSFEMITMDGGELSTIIKNMTPVLPSDLPPGVSQQQGFELEPPTKQLSTMIREKKKLILFKAKSLGYSAPEISTLAEEFDKRVMNIKKNIIKDELVSIPQGQRGTFFKRLESALQQGQSSSIARELPPEVFNALFSSEGEDQLELINMARTNWFDQLDNDNKVIAHRSNIRGHTKDKNTDNFNTGLMKFMFPKGNTDLEIEQDKSNGLTMMTEALSVFQQQGFTEEYGTFKTTFDKVTRTSTDNGVTGYNSMALYDNTDVVTRFQTDLANINPALSVADVQIAFNKNQITLETYIDLSGKYKTNLSNEDQAAIKLIKNKLDMSDNFYVDKEFLSTQKNKIYTATLAKYITDKAAAGNDFDPLKWVENNMPNVVRDVANANPIPGQVLHQAFQGKLNNQGKAYTLGGQTAFLTHYKNQTRGMLNRFIRKAIADGNTEMAERLQRDKEILDELVADPNFDSQQIPHYRLDDN